MDEIKSAAKEIDTAGLKCSNCHLRNHTIRSCVSEQCKSRFDCGDLNKHLDVKTEIVELTVSLMSIQITRC